MKQEVIKVDFINKTVLNRKTRIQEVYKCYICNHQYKYDNKYDHRRPLLLGVRDKYFCASCVETMNQTVQDTKKALEEE